MLYLFDHLDSVSEVLALTPLGLITDIDGTISDIAPFPEEARVSLACRDSLATLAGQLELVAAVSGRPALQARDMVGVEGVVYIGNHGLERWAKGTIEFVPGVEDYLDKVKRALGELKELLTLDGILFEDKGLSLSVHYRQCPDGESARRYILERISATAIAKEFSIIEGRRVVELRPPLDVDKGDAVLALVERHRLRCAIYLGDDISDLDAFVAIHSGSRSSPFKGLALGVIDEETSPLVAEEADFTLYGVGDVERFLKWLVETVAALRH